MNRFRNPLKALAVFAIIFGATVIAFRSLIFAQPSTSVLTPTRIPVRWVDRGGTNFIEFYDPKATVRIRQGTAPDIIISNGVFILNAIKYPDGSIQTSSTNFSGGTNGGTIVVSNIITTIVQGTNGDPQLIFGTNIQAFGQCPKFSMASSNLNGAIWSAGIDCNNYSFVIIRNSPGGHWVAHEIGTNGGVIMRLSPNQSTNRGLSIVDQSGNILFDLRTNRTWTGTGSNVFTDNGTFTNLAQWVQSLAAGSSGSPWTNNGLKTYLIADPGHWDITNAAGNGFIYSGAAGDQALFSWSVGHYKITSLGVNDLQLGSAGGVQWTIETGGGTLAPQANGQKIGRSGAVIGSIATTNVTYDAADPNPIHLTGGVANDPVVLVYDGTNVVVNVVRGNFFTLSVTSRFMLTFTNSQTGRKGVFPGYSAVINARQDGTGGRTVFFDPIGSATNDAGCILSTAANARDKIFVAADDTGTNADIVLHLNFR